MTERPQPGPDPRGGPESANSGGSLFKQVAKHSVVYGLGMIISRLVSFIMLPVYLRFLTPADYGVMFLVEMTLDFISIVGGAQLALGIFRFYHKADDEAERQQVVSTAFVMVSILYAVMGIGTFLGADALSSLIFGDDGQGTVIRIAAANLGVTSLMVVPMALARLRDLSTLLVGTNLAKLLLMVTLNVLFIVGLGLGVVGIFLSSLIANTLVGCAATAWMLRHVRLAVSPRYLRELVRYGVPLVGVQMSTFVATFADRYFLQAAADEVLVGLYGLAYQFGFLMVVVGFSPIETVWGPKRFDVARQENREQVLARGFVLINVAVITTGVGIVLYVGDVLRIVARPDFYAAARVVPVILVAYVLQCWAAVQDIGVLVQEKTKYLTVANAVAAVVAVVAYAVLIPRYLEWGAAFATVLAFATRYVMTYRYSQRLWPLRYQWRPVWVLVAWAVTICGLALAMPEFGVLASLAIRTGLVLVFGLGVWLLPVLEAEERDEARRMALVLWRSAVARLRGRASRR